MKKETLNKMLRENGNTGTCERAADMIALLYGEASGSEAKDFEHHIERCALCRTEFSAFGRVREAIGTWRNQSLGSLAFPVFESSVAPALVAVSTQTLARKPSMIAALRELFTLSPVWMRAATAVMSIVVCALVVLAVAHAEIRWDAQGFSFSTGVLAKTVAADNNAQIPALAQTDRIYTREELNAIVAEKVRLEREALLNEMNSKPELVAISTIGTRPNNKRGSASGSGKVASRNTTATPSTPRVNTERVPQLLARDEEDNLPRLSDLLSETR